MRSPRVWIALASLLLAALLIGLFLPRNDGAFRAIPAQTALLLECKGLLRTKILTDKTADAPWQEVLHGPLFTQCFEEANAAIQLFKHDPVLFRAFAQNKAIVAYTLHPADSLHGFFALELEAAFDLENGLKTNKLTPKYFQHQFHGNNIFNVHLSKTERLEVAVYGKLLLFSRKATLVEDALAQLENARNWWTDRAYISELPGAPLQVHLRPSALAEQWRNQMTPRWRGLPDLLARNAEWIGLSWDGKAIATLAEAKGFFSNLGAWGGTSDDLIFNVLPDNTAFLARTGLSNIPDFFRQIGTERSRDFEQFVLPWAGREVALVVTEPLSPALSGDRLVLLSVRDSAQAIQKLQDFGKERGLLPGFTGKYQMFEVWNFQNASLLKPLLGDDEAFRNPVCAVVGGFAVFAPDRSSLEIFLDKYLVNQTLAAHVDFLQLQQKQGQKGNAYFLLNTAYLPSLLQQLLGAPGDDSWSKTGFISAEILPKFGRKMECQLSNQSLSKQPDQTNILWKSVFESPVATQPFLIHQPGEKMVVLAQDLKNKLHCLNAQNGDREWTRALPNHILSSIQGIDFFGNGTLCYTFSTATQLYTLDENGRDVQGFPLALSAKASNGVSVIDFDQSTKFYSFIACENGKIYGFGPSGKPLDGWNGLKIDGVVRQPILHFQHKSKDYLAVLTETGLLSVFGRDGALRFDPVQLEEATAGGQFLSPMKVDLDASSPQIYCANTKGKIFACDLKGNVTAQQVGKAGSVVAFGQLFGNAQFEWAAFSEKSLKIGAWGKAFSLGHSFPQFSAPKPMVFFPSNHKIGVVDPRTRRVWCLDQNGKIAPGFPLGGNTAFELTPFNGVNMLVVGNTNGVWAYRIR